MKPLWDDVKTKLFFGYVLTNCHMKILYLHSTTIDSEKANLIQVLNMCNAFSKIGHEVTLIIKKSKTEHLNDKDYILNKFGIEVPYPLVFFEGGLSLFGRFREMGLLFSNIWSVTRNEIKKTKYDIVFIRSPIFLPLVKRFHIPVVYEIHNHLVHQDSRILNYVWKRMLLKYCYVGVITKIVVISEALKKIWVSEGIAPDKILACHDGFNTAHFEVELTKEEARALLEIKTEKKVVTYAGSLYADRGIGLILKAAKQIPDAIFYVVGGPQDKVDYFKKSVIQNQVKNIVFTGRVSPREVRNYLFASDILLLIFTSDVPTINYCSPLKLFEYMASGRTIVGHAFPTIKEVLTNSLNAVLVEPENDDEFIEGLKRTIAIEDESLGKNARVAAFEHYRWETRAMNLVPFFKD